MNSIPISTVARVTVQANPTFPRGAGFGVLAILGVAARLPIGDRLRFYTDMDGVAADFSSSDPEYLAAQVAFAQTPKPVEVAIGRRFVSAVPGEILGSLTHTKVVATWAAITNGGFDISIDGANEQIYGIDFTGVTTLNGVATKIQEKLALASSGSTCIYDGTRFIIRSGTTGATSDVGYAVAPTGGSSPTNLATMLGMTSALHPKLSVGVAAESLTETLDALDDLSSAWYGFGFAGVTLSDDDIVTVADWTEARTKIFGFTTQDSAVADEADDTDIASVLSVSDYSRTFSVWNEYGQYAQFSLMARAFGVNFAQPKSTLTLKFKQLPTITASDITRSQQRAFQAKHVNYYTLFGDSAMLAEGQMANGRFFDEVHGLDWLKNDIETRVFGFLLTRSTKVAQTDDDYAGVTQKVVESLQAGVFNGLLAPGTWNGEEFGELKAGQYLDSGFYVYTTPMALQSQGDREARIGPPIRAAAKGGGAVHFTDILVNFER